MDRNKDLIYFLGATKLLSLKMLMLISHFHPRFQSLSALGGFFYTQSCPLGARFLFVVWRLEIVRVSEVKTYYSYDKLNWGHVVCSLYGGGPHLGESIMGDSIVFSLNDLTHIR